MKLGFCLAFVATLLTAPAVYSDWASWRGPEASGVSRETDTPASFNDQVLWRQPITGGRSTPVVLNNRVYVSTRGGTGITEHERVICYDAATGKVLWEDPINVFHTTIPGPRVGWANPTGDPETGYVYFHGVEGLLKCYDPDGKVVWSRSLTEEFGRISGYGGRTNTPVIDENLVILSFLNSSWGGQGKGAHRFVAFDKRSGEVIWWSSPGGKPLDTTYSTPVVTVIDGVRLLICGCADGAVYALKVRTGEKVWGYPFSKRGINVSPVVSGSRIYIAHSEENLDSTRMGRVVCLDGKGKEVWRADGLAVGYGSPLVHDDRVYVLDNSANLISIDSGSGSVVWKHSVGKVGKASPVWADGKIYVGEVNGRFHIVEPGRKDCRSLDEVLLQGPDGSPSEVFGSAAVSGGRVYLCSRDETICLGKKKWNGKKGAVPGLEPEASIESDKKPSRILVTPADVLLGPGASESFRVRLYNDRGQYIGDAESAEWKLTRLSAEVGAAGALKISSTAGYNAGLVEARVDDLKASARVRVVPELPIVLDFEKVPEKKLPSGLIGLSPIKFRTETLDGNRVLVKHGTHQRFNRAIAFLGPPEMSNYTIQADLRGVFRRRTLPDMGVINQRYRLKIMGVDQVLRILTWVPQKRFEKDIPFEWKEDIWYRMKFRVEPRGDRTLLQGKVWNRDEAEPAEWTISVEDPFPHLEGSPGLYAYTAGTTARSRGTDVYFDNVRVSSN